MNKKMKKIGDYTWKYILAALLCGFALIPFLWIVATSFNGAKSLLGANLIPSSLTLSNYIELLSSKTLNYSQWFFNSLKVSFISVLLIVFLTSLAAYVLSRFRFKSKKYLLFGIMILNVFPGILAMIAIFSMLQQLGTYIPFLGLNTHGGLIAIYVAGAMSINVLMVKSYIDTIPIEIDESALVEGASYWQTFWIMIFPMIRPIIVTVAILAFMATYGDFIIANILLKGNDKITVMVGIFQFTQQRFDTDWGVVMAGTVIAALPALIIFFIAQRHIIDGLTAGSVKQ
ncbi:MAG: ABC transporter permease subunit [Spirochaetaceae bacterium]|jgi:arabinogalactan oligomer/maltooligosaccharide transport system permease protein|nr:ABC transporter permease subunit [Spirochaetaceae bacterium]